MSEVIPRNSPYAPVRVQPLHESKDKERSTMRQKIRPDQFGSASAGASQPHDGGVGGVMITLWSTRGNYKAHQVISRDTAKALIQSLDHAIAAASTQEDDPS